MFVTSTPDVHIKSYSVLQVGSNGQPSLREPIATSVAQ